MSDLWRIYGWRNIYTDEWYVGCTTRMPKRRAGHDGINYVKKNGAFGRAIEEYGWPSFEENILGLYLTKEEAEEAERRFIKEKNSLYPNGYNLEDGGTISKKMHKTTHNRLLELGEQYKEEYRERYKNDPSYSKKVYQFTKDGEFVAEFPSAMEVSRFLGISSKWVYSHLNGKRKSLKGYVWSYENVFPEWTRERKPSSAKGKHNTKKSKSVQQLTMNGELVAEYPSISEVQRQTGFKTPVICRVCLGQRESAYGFLWRYK